MDATQDLSSAAFLSVERQLSVRCLRVGRGIAVCHFGFGAQWGPVSLPANGSLFLIALVSLFLPFMI